MRLTVLVDNNTLIGHYFLGEPGVSYLIEEGDRRILFDVGYSDAFIRNADRMGIDLLQLDWLVLSHGHLDHTWGLEPLLRLYTEAAIESRPAWKPVLVAHPSLFEPKSKGHLPDIGAPYPEEKLSRHFGLQLSSEPVWLTERLVFLGQVPRRHAFEGQETVGSVQRDGEEVPDPVLDDSALAYRSDAGLVIITGCSHSGICNITDAAREVCGEERVTDIVGGLHLQKPTRERLAGVMDYMKGLDLGALHAGHCTDLASRVALSRVAPLEEVGVGLRLFYDEPAN